MPDDELEPTADAADEERVPRPPIVIPKSSRLAIGVVVIVVGLVLLIVGAAALKAVGAVLVVGGVVDVVVGRRQAL